MKSIASNFIRQTHTAPWVDDPSAVALVDYVYSGGIWDRQAREKYPAIHQKKVSELSIDEIYAFLTFIIVMDRTREGCIDAHIADGTIAALLTRWLEINKEVDA